MSRGTTAVAGNGNGNAGAGVGVEGKGGGGNGEIVSGEHPYMRIGGHKDGRDLRYGGLERYKKEVREIESDARGVEKELRLGVKH